MIVNDPLGRTKHYAVRIEFYVRSIVHIHLLLWVLDAPVLTTNNKQEKKGFLNSIFKQNFPDYQENLQVYQLEATCQIHSY